MFKINLSVANDNGNSEQAIIINGELIKSPSVNARISKLPNLEELNLEKITQNIENNLVVSVVSDTCKTGDYLIGTYAIGSKERLNNIKVGPFNSKVDSDIPFCNTHSILAGYAVKQMVKSMGEKDLSRDVVVMVSMVTGLPADHYNKKAAKLFASKFMDNDHLVTVHLPNVSINVKVIYEYVKVLPEGVTVPMYLSLMEKGSKVTKDVLSTFFSDYKIDANIFDPRIFACSTILNGSVGEGTTERCLVKSLAFDPRTIKDAGSNNGVGHAIDECLSDFIKDNHLLKYTRQDFSAALKSAADKYHSKVWNSIEIPLEKQSNEIFELMENDVTMLNNNVDFIIVYGGGAICMKDTLHPALKNFGDMVDVKIVYISEKYATEIEALGFETFLKSDKFKQLKAKFMDSKSVTA